MWIVSFCTLVAKEDITACSDGGTGMVEVCSCRVSEHRVTEHRPEMT